MQQVLVSSKHRMLGIDDRVKPIDGLFPNTQRVSLNGGTYALVPHEPAETFMLRALGYDVPAPILSYYGWPHPEGQPPFYAQKMTAALLTQSARAYVLNGLGTGKTRSALWAWDYLYGKKLCKKLLVVAPLSTLKFTWAREVFATLPHRKCAVLHGSKEKRRELLHGDSDIYIINHDGVKVIWDALYQWSYIDTVVLDELAVYRNGGAGRTKAMRKLCAPNRMAFVWGMTGSPMPNSPTDVWAQATIITPHTVPKYYKSFQDNLMLRVSQFKFVPKEDAVEKAYRALQPAVRYTLDDVYELPETVQRTMDVEVGPQQKKVYAELATTCYSALQAGEITAANAGAVMSKLLQVSTGWVYTKDRGVASLDNDKRIKLLVDTILGNERKLLVFVPFKHALAGISEALTKEGIDHAVVSGDTQPSIRSDVFNAFQNTFQYKVLAAHPKCLAHGITLTMADTIVWFSPVTDLETYEQANARISRVGQKHKQLVLHFQGTPVEKRIYQLLRTKQRVQDKLLELFEIATEEFEG